MNALRAAAAALALLLPALSAADTPPADACLPESAQAGLFQRCERAVEAAPRDVALRRLLAQALMMAGENQRSLAELQTVARLAPEDGRAHFDVAVMLAALRRFEEAVAPLYAALARGRGDQEFLRLAVIIHQQLAQPELAVPFLQQLADHGDDLAMADLAHYYETGTGLPQDHREAVKWLRRAGETAHVGALERLARAYRRGELGLIPDTAEADALDRRAAAVRAGSE